jgi:hypothetical protein
VLVEQYQAALNELSKLKTDERIPQERKGHIINKMKVFIVSLEKIMEAVDNSA